MKMTKMVRRCLILGLVVLFSGAAPVLAEGLIPLGGGMVYDPGADITWLNSSGGPTTYAGAVEWVEDRTVCGYTDWRLPTQTELQALAGSLSWDENDECLAPFDNVLSQWYWTSTSYNQGHHVLVHLQGGGSTEPEDTYQDGHVIAVRDGMPNCDGSPKEALADLIAIVEDLDVPKGIKTSLLAKLDVAYKVLDDANGDNDEAAVNALNDFIEFVEEKRGKPLSEDDADALTQAASDVICLIEGAP